MISWKNVLRLCLCLGLVAISQAPAADTALTPKPTAAATLPTFGPRTLRHILIAESLEAAQNLKAGPESPFVVLSPGLSSFSADELNKRLAVGLGRPIEERILVAIGQVIEGYMRENEYPTALATVPSQNIGEGDVRFVMALGVRSKSIVATEWKIRKIKMDKTRWFSDSLLREKLRVEQGQTIRWTDLEQAINYTNNSPFRRVQVQLDPVPNSTGEADLTVAVQESLPLKLAASFSNSGNEVVGKNQYTAAVSYANVWGRDHQLSYQFITTDRPKFFQAHGIDYKIPLPWRHDLSISGSYLRAKPELLSGLIQQEGETKTAEIRYSMPVRIRNNAIDAYAAIQFKQSNNNLAYYGTQVNNTNTDIFQLTLGASTILRDRRGGWLFGATVTGSPGGISRLNTDAAFDAGNPKYADANGNLRGDSARFGATASYLYGQVSVQRLLTLIPGVDWSARAVVQASNANLLSSEQLGIGGAATVRGFNESTFTGDHGFFFTNDLLFPSWKKNLPKISKTRGPLDIRPLVFFDVGNVGEHQPFASDPPHRALASAGTGVRMTLGTNFSLSADYGWQITNLPYVVDKQRRGHIKATLAF